MLALDADVAGHLAVAVYRHRQALDLQGHACPDGLAELEALLAKVAKSQERSRAITARRPGHAGPVRQWLSPSEVAEETGLSIATVRRRLADGGLRSALVGRRRRVQRAELTRFMAGEGKP